MQVAYCFVRPANVIEMLQAAYPVMTGIGRALQLLVFIVFRHEINRLLADMQKFVNLSIIKIVSEFTSGYCVVF